MYKYKYKYESNPERIREEDTLYKQGIFTSQKKPPIINGEPEPGYLFSNFFAADGQFFTMYPGQESPDLKGFHHRVVSVYVGLSNSVVIYKNSNFSGEKLYLLKTGQHNLKNYVFWRISGPESWSNWVGSIRVLPYIY
jgi:hypothetical protein